MVSDKESKRALREAAEWHARLNARDLSQEELQAFFAWRRLPTHSRAYEEVDKLWSSSAALGANRNIAQAVHTALARPRWRRNLMVFEDLVHRHSVAASLILVLSSALIFGVVQRPAFVTYETARGEQRIIPLADGSIIHLDTATRVKVRLAASSRQIELIEGRALFTVAHDANRPFIVHVGSADIEAIGTRFDVDAPLDGAPEVVLVQGRLALGQKHEDMHSLMDAGYAARFDPDGWSAPHKADMDIATSWTTGRLRFQATPLAVAVAQINRYAEQPLALSTPQNANILVSGTFDARDTRGFADAVQALYGLRLTPQPDGSASSR